MFNPIISAKLHISTCKEQVSSAIKESYKKSIIYADDPIYHHQLKNIYINTYKNVDEMIYQAKIKTNNNPLFIIFGSYKYPAYSFRKGILDDEAEFCFKSNFYNILKKNYKYYRYNREHLNYGLYKDRALYLPDVLIGSDKCDVLLLSLPNKSAERFNGVDHLTVYKAFLKRLRFMYQVLDKIGYRDFIGCCINNEWEKELLEVFDEGLFGDELAEDL